MTADASSCNGPVARPTGSSGTPTTWSSSSRGPRPQAQALLDQLAERCEALGLKLKAEKTAITHIDEGFVFLGQRIIRRPKGTEALRLHLRLQRGARLVRRKVKALTGRSTTNMELSELLAALNRVLRGWANYFRQPRQTHARLPRLLRLVASRAMASQEAPAAHLEADQPALRQRRQLPRRKGSRSSTPAASALPATATGAQRSRPRGPTDADPDRRARQARATSEQLSLERVQQALA